MRTGQRWDGYRRISAWAGLLAFFSVIAIVIIFGDDLSGGSQEPSTTWSMIGILTGPGVLAGLVSGSRFFALYADYSERLSPTAELSDADSASGSNVVRAFMGDGIWGSIIAGIAGGIVATLALSILFGAFAGIFHPLFVVAIALAWFTGWAVGALASMFLSTTVGIAFGTGKRKSAGGRLPWILAATILPVILLAVTIPILGTRFSDGRSDSWGAIFAVAGFSVEGAEFFLNDTLRIIAVFAIWVGAVLFAAIVVVGTPALLERQRQRYGGDSIRR